jgi:predicted  nucleic acid-binding Zn-ribbon protein
MKIYVCSDCGSEFQEGFIPAECPNCGCPSDFFTEKVIQKPSHLQDDVLECPDCGKIFDEEPIPSSCPNCGCPSSNFKMHVEKKSNTSSTQQGNIQKMILITVSIIAVIGGFVYFAYNKAQETAEQVRQEQYAKERAAQAEKERQEEERAKDQRIRELRQAKEKFLGTYSSTSVSGGYQSGYGRFYITFYSDNTFDLRFVDSYTRNVIDRQAGTYTFVYQKTPREDGGGRLIDSSGRLINEYYIATLGFSINIGDYYLTK